MNRRDIVLALLALGAAPHLAFAQQSSKIWRIGHLSPRSGPDATVEAFREQLRSLGYVEGRNTVFEFRWAAGKEERILELAAELARLKVDVIVTRTTFVAAAAKRATSTIPIVMAGAADPGGSEADGHRPRNPGGRHARSARRRFCRHATRARPGAGCAVQPLPQQQSQEDRRTGGEAPPAVDVR